MPSMLHRVSAATLAAKAGGGRVLEQGRKAVAGFRIELAILKIFQLPPEFRQVEKFVARVRRLHDVALPAAILQRTHALKARRNRCRLPFRLSASRSTSRSTSRARRFNSFFNFDVPDDNSGPFYGYRDTLFKTDEFLVSLGYLNDPQHAAADATGWVAIAGDAGFSAGSAATSPPVTTDADGDFIAAPFDPVDLKDGRYVRLTGSVTLDAPLAGGASYRPAQNLIHLTASDFSFNRVAFQLGDGFNAHRRQFLPHREPGRHRMAQHHLQQRDLQQHPVGRALGCRRFRQLDLGFHVTIRWNSSMPRSPAVTRWS